MEVFKNPDYQSIDGSLFKARKRIRNLWQHSGHVYQRLTAGSSNTHPRNINWT